jgi:hypothetical protein
MFMSIQPAIQMSFKKLFSDAVGELRKINFKIRAFISDVGSNFVKISNILNISPEHPFFYADSDLLDENNSI